MTFVTICGKKKHRRGFAAMSESVIKKPSKDRPFDKGALKIVMSIEQAEVLCEWLNAKLYGLKILAKDA